MQMRSIYRSFLATIHSMWLLIWKIVHKQRNSTSNKLCPKCMFDAESSWVSLTLIVIERELRGRPLGTTRGVLRRVYKKWTNLGFVEISRKKLTCAVASGRVYGNYDRKKQNKTKQNWKQWTAYYSPTRPGEPHELQEPRGRISELLTTIFGMWRIFPTTKNL